VEVDVDWGCFYIYLFWGDDFVGREVCLCGFDLLWGDGRSTISDRGMGVCAIPSES